MEIFEAVDFKIDDEKKYLGHVKDILLEDAMLLFVEKAVLTKSSAFFYCGSGIGRKKLV